MIGEGLKANSSLKELHLVRLLHYYCDFLVCFFFAIKIEVRHEGDIVVLNQICVFIVNCCSL